MHLLILFLIFNFSNIDDQWVKYFENKNIKISYKDTLCDDIQNGFSFYYYLIKIENKTNETFVINFFLGEEVDKKEENKVAFVLNPYETKTGDCKPQITQLKLFKANHSNKKSYLPKRFNLNNIETIEVY
tara:strand:- start:4905 stop:5294 length:390 start_codon:yes stop_codon:yes gene_type:complete